MGRIRRCRFRVGWNPRGRVPSVDALVSDASSLPPCSGLASTVRRPTPELLLDAREALKRVPAGLDPEHPRADLLKLKGLIAVTSELDRALLTKHALVDRLVDCACACRSTGGWCATTSMRRVVCSVRSRAPCDRADPRWCVGSPAGFARAFARGRMTSARTSFAWALTPVAGWIVATCVSKACRITFRGCFSTLAQSRGV